MSAYVACMSGNHVRAKCSRNGPIQSEAYLIYYISRQIHRMTAKIVPVGWGKEMVKAMLPTDHSVCFTTLICGHERWVVTEGRADEENGVFLFVRERVKTSEYSTALTHRKGSLRFGHLSTIPPG